MRSRAIMLVAAALAAGCAGGVTPQGPPSRTAPFRSGLSLPAHAVIGFSVDTARRAAVAAREGITATILYWHPPSPKSALGTALRAHHIGVIDGYVSDLVSSWECHRTHTVAPPPKSYSGGNTYCATDEYPHMTTAKVLADLRRELARDERLPYVVGYWVLDDWAWWDPGSGRALLQKVHALIAQTTPGRPALCGFGAGIGKPGSVSSGYWDPGTAANYSNAGCDVVGWYNYACIECSHPSSGKQLDWSMKTLLPAMAKSLENYGWSMATTPLYGIGQAWSGSYAKRYYTWGLTRAEMVAQASAFCSFGATYIGWYAWDDSGFDARTQTPNNSATIAAGIGDGLAACKRVWGS